MPTGPLKCDPVPTEVALSGAPSGQQRGGQDCQGRTGNRPCETTNRSLHDGDPSQTQGSPETQPANSLKAHAPPPSENSCSLRKRKKSQDSNQSNPGILEFGSTVSGPVQLIRIGMITYRNGVLVLARRGSARRSARRRPPSLSRAFSGVDAGSPG
jgi:hypothetical protein